ncbi:hypothetical protein EMIHUDRAFT_449234 [Emiliania huxleyi CCMP1516]|uniref:Uncharacterized protein n=2 Tax=Emiliania huxleyi TaxID=2903 RepID=A0A0D3KI77_EMIH1|nr:hypothetical protein EMIHUDRAFT_449234 [Emiliania huxleyi CCMP1516]EOD35462.1 hypothetical protein EMIHUDRAFT_449234 [Emiliania huxleyi CCMP1516]|eukprot:XP_005787891.1 hypothetical protein EMIHUDRAFT_449234 [Emiliania huxleyi CCMP1516]
MPRANAPTLRLKLVQRIACAKTKYIAGITPPNVACDALEFAHNRIRKSFESIARADASPQALRDLAWLQAQLPTEMGGDCEWRLPDGGYRFDVLKATKPKWVPCYLRRDFGDERGCHEPRWASALFPGGGEVTRAQFGEALAGLGFEMPMGPRGSVGADGGMPESAADALWAWLAGDGDALTPEGARTRLQAMAEDPQAEGAVGEGPDHLALGAKPFEMIV